MSVLFETDDVLAARIRVVAAQLDQADLAAELGAIAFLLDPVGGERDAGAPGRLFEPGSFRP